MTSEDELGTFVSAYQAAIELEAGYAMTPDIADAIDRAMADDPPEHVRSLRASLRHDPEGVDTRDPGLAPFTAALAGTIEARAHERSLGTLGIPPQPRTPRRIAPLVIVTGLAAACVLAVGLARWLSPAALVEDGFVPELASQQHEPSAEGGEAVQRTVPARRPRASEPSISPPPPPEPEPAPETQPRRRRVERASLDELEVAAAHQWEAGQLEQAEASLRAIIARAGTSSRAELAYGDLFAVVRQRRGETGQAKVWADYLEAFPAGRFAEDIRAGQCRRSASAPRSACWRAYLKAYPRGTHSEEALQSAPTPDPMSELP